MAHGPIILLCISSMVTLGCWIPGTTAGQSKRICTTTVLKTKSIISSNSIIGYYTACSGGEVCSSERTRWETQYYRGYQKVYLTIFECCHGYRSETIEPLDCRPFCPTGCQNGDCIAPDECACYVGWKGDRCDDDVNECTEMNHGCSESCVNTLGNYHCSCPQGYELSSNGKTCEDIRECTNSRELCKQVCKEVPGSYVCSCNDGYELDDNQHSCSAICNKQCIHGSCEEPYTCTCDSGWSGSTCDTVSCESGCVNGDCIDANLCTCHFGWTGDSCNIGICLIDCVHGTCTGPNVCTCHHGWTGYTCNTGICNDGCSEGDCVSPNNCSCNLGWTGHTCENDLCDPGSYSESGYEPCKDCPLNYYQLNYGSSSCEPCDDLIPETGHTCMTMLPSATEAVSDVGMTTYVIIGSVTGSIVVIAVFSLIFLMTVLFYKKYKKPSFLGSDLYDTRSNTYREFGIRSSSSNGMEMSQENTNHSADEIHSNIPPPPPIDGIVPKPPPPYVPKPLPLRPPMQLHTLDANLSSKPPPPSKVLSPLSSVLQSSKKREPEEEYDTFTDVGLSKAKETMKKIKKESSSTETISSTFDASVVRNDGTGANTNFSISHNDIPFPPKPPPASAPKSSHISSSMLPHKTPPSSEKPAYDSRSGVAYSVCKVFRKKDIPYCNSSATQPERSFQSESTASIPSTPKPRPIPSLTVKSNEKPDAPPKVFSPKSPLAPPAGRNDKQHHFSTAPSVALKPKAKLLPRLTSELPASVGKGKTMREKNSRDTNPSWKLSSSVSSPVYKSSAGDLHSSASVCHKQEKLPSTKPRFQPERPSDFSSIEETKLSPYNNSAGELLSSTVGPHKKPMFPNIKPTVPNKPSVVLRSPFVPFASQSSQKEFPSETLNTSKPTTFPRELVKIPPNLTHTTSTKQQPLKPQPKVFTCSHSFASPTSKIPCQDVVEIYDDPLDLHATPNQQTPLSKRNIAPLPKPTLHQEGRY